MPMFQEQHLGSQDPAPGVASGQPDPMPIHVSFDTQRLLSRRVSEESIRTDLCEGPVPDSPPAKPVTPEQELSNTVSDRAELIERLKRGESPTWVPNRHLETLYLQNRAYSPPSRTPKPPNSPTSAGLLPAPNITPEKQDGKSEGVATDQRLQEGLNIERPRSALHSGNFTPEEPSPDLRRSHDQGLRDEDGPFRSSSTPWMATSPPRDFTHFNFGRSSADYRREAFRTSGPSSLSSSISSSFVYKPPTSPLVQSESNEDVDLTLPLDGIKIVSGSPRNNPRRHTLNFASSPYATAASERQVPHRRESTHPYQAHQPRRSLTSAPTFSFTGSSPQTSANFRSRRPSFSAEASPLHHASLVGSYEESILRGRMSTTPSKPLDFMAQIGVLGLGKCKPSLRCPSHITLPFSAVFYSYGSTSHGRTKMEDGPSPYVGQIDLENGLPSLDENQRAKRKLQTRYAERRAPEEESYMHDNPAELSEGDARKSMKQRRRARSPKVPPGGRYRIPEKGQLQIIIKNQNKTAVKLFLVPYDLAGMEPGTKTFVRQRSYSAGPILDNIPDSKDADPAADRPTLRYLVHLHICSTSRGRFYLYKNIRVVFANRVPDGKEKLRNEITYPEPRFTPYKPVRAISQSSGGPALAAEQAFRRRSSGFSFAHHHPLPPLFDGLNSSNRRTGSALAVGAAGTPMQGVVSSIGGGSGTGNNVPVDSAPFGLFLSSSQQILHAQSGGEGGSSESIDTTIATAGDNHPSQSLSDSEFKVKMRPFSSTTSSWVASQQQDTKMSGVDSPTGSSSFTTTVNTHFAKYDKLSKNDVGYGGNAFASLAKIGRTGSTESILSQRLRSLGVQPGSEPPKDDVVNNAEEWDGAYASSSSWM
ncbi:hypothetical protein B0H63DRAFT_131210 [Podospora didyma]|uniref:Atos-like conserved domain-containing protein n=1 Tax=Podospora didyma TaxID=330526 RepID=A0AAE0U582_9PEZI|nr:hypothetical protein B0H63DRAFT_131210 [Podospora didyma]